MFKMLFMSMGTIVQFQTLIHRWKKAFTSSTNYPHVNMTNKKLVKKQELNATNIYIVKSWKGGIKCKEYFHSIEDFFRVKYSY